MLRVNSLRYVASGAVRSLNLSSRCLSHQMESSRDTADKPTQAISHVSLDRPGVGLSAVISLDFKVIQLS